MFDVVGAASLGDWIIAHQPDVLILRQDRIVKFSHQCGYVLLAQHGRSSDSIKQFLGADIEVTRKAAGDGWIRRAQTARKLCSIEEGL